MCSLRDTTGSPSQLRRHRSRRRPALREFEANQPDWCSTGPDRFVTSGDSLESGLEVVATGVTLQGLARPSVEALCGYPRCGHPLHLPPLRAVVSDGVVLRRTVVP